MRANPQLLTGVNKYWVRFFVLAVFATMYVRDHARPEFHKALGVDPTEYGFQVFRITSEISKQVFPLTIDIDNPAFKAHLDRLLVINDSLNAAEKQGGFMGSVKQKLLGLQAGVTFLRLFFMPAKEHALPESSRLAPVW